MKGTHFLVKVIDFVAAIYLFLLANFYFWGPVFGILLLSARNPESQPNLWYFFSNMIFAPFLMYGAVIFFRKSEIKYLYALILLTTVLLETQIYRFFFVTHYRLEMVDLSNLLSFGIPMLTIYYARGLSRRGN